MNVLSRLVLLLSLLLVSACGSHEGDAGSYFSPWVTVSSPVIRGDTAELTGTAWISRSWAAYHCAGLACLYDTRTDDFPGVYITWTNRTVGVSGLAESLYGGGTNWRHLWYGTVPLASGTNTIDLAAMDPSGRGGRITISVEGP